MSATKTSSATSIVQTAIVTGASRGMGRPIALRLVADGFKNAVNYPGIAVKADVAIAASAEVAAHGE